MEYLLISNIFTAIAIIVAYTLGLRNRQKIDNGVSVIPNVVERIKEVKVKKEEKKENERLNKILTNIDIFNGTAEGQEKVR